jgi:triosephosphate isomerase
MYTNAQTARELARGIVEGLKGDDRVTVAVCPPFPYLAQVADVLKGSPVGLGAQDVFHEKEGAFTGEVSPAMLLDVGCKYVIVGHSERRHVLGESDALINEKLHAALEAGLHVILCMGETLAERQRNLMQRVFQRQVYSAVAGLTDDQFGRLTIAYEPVWAIGTGHNATPEQAQEAHGFVRQKLSGLYGDKIADSLLIQYGGSVKPDNAAAILRQPDVDGALVGGASLKAASFLEIVAAAR